MINFVDICWNGEQVLDWYMRDCSHNLIWFGGGVSNPTHEELLTLVVL